MNSPWRVLVSSVVLASCAVAGAQLPEQYPKPLIHTPADHPAARVILISVDGLRAIDLATWVADHPQSALAELSGRGVTWTNAHVPWADTDAGLVAMVTGGTPISTGIVSSDGYDRTLSPARSGCKIKGTALKLEGAMNEAALPLDAQKNCSTAHPHEALRVNTIFEVVSEKIGATAWAGETAMSTDLLRGPSGKGLTEACSFDEATPEAADAARLHAVLHWIDGRDCAAARDVAVPALFGMSYASLAAAQRAYGLGVEPQPVRAKSMNALDDGLREIIAELKSKHLYDSTWIVVAGPYGQAAVSRVIPLQQLTAAVDSLRAHAFVHASGGDIGMIWLTDHKDTEAVVRALWHHAKTLGIEDIYAGRRLGLTLNMAADDGRMPDIVLQPAAGILWAQSGDPARAAHGGLTDADTHVALLVAGKQLAGRTDKTWVPTTQLAPLLLRAFGMEKFDLSALHPEHTPALPGIF